MEYLLIGIGAAATSFCAILWMGLPWFLIAILRKRIAGAKYRTHVSAFSLSSLPAIAGARTVYEFIQGLGDADKRGVYNDVMGNMRKLLMDIKRHRTAYPAAIEELKKFVLIQLRYNIEHSAIREAFETSKFRDLAEVFVLTEVMQDIYTADCKASRSPLGRMSRGDDDDGGGLRPFAGGYYGKDL